MLFFCVLSTIQNENQARQTRTEEDALLVRVGQGDREALETLYRLDLPRCIWMPPIHCKKSTRCGGAYAGYVFAACFQRGELSPTGKAQRLHPGRGPEPGPYAPAGGTAGFPAAGEEETETLPAAGNEAGRAEDRLVLECAMRVLGDEERQVVMLHAVARA